MTRLLVSVRSANEACEAFAGGADIIDAKEPNNGALGRCDFATIDAIKAAVGTTPFSVALGELKDAAIPAEMKYTSKWTYAKVGLSGCRDRVDWADAWRQFLRLLPADCRPVAVAYADTTLARSPNVSDVLRAARSHEVTTLLLDTFSKHGQTLLDFVPQAALAELIAECQSARIQIALAGSLGRREIDIVLPMKPDIVAVRGSVCSGGRQGCVDSRRVRQIATQIHSI